MDDLPSFSGPLTAFAIELWLNECYSQLLGYNQGKIIADRLNELDLVQKAGLKISHQGVTQALADWFDSTRDFHSWNDFKVRLKEQALGSNWLAHAVRALFTTRQEDRDTDAYLRDLDELYSVIQNSIKENRGDKARALKSINGDVLKYIMLFNAKPAVTAEIMQSGLDIVAANVSWMRICANGRNSSLAQPATSTDNDSGASPANNPEGNLSNEKGGEGTKEKQSNIPGDEDLSQPAPKIAPVARRWVEGPSLTGHTSSVTHIAFSPVGEIMASASRDKTVRIWDLATGWIRGTLYLSDEVRDVTFSPDGKLVACAYGKHVVLRTVDGFQGSAAFSGTTLVLAVSFSPDNKLLAAGCEGSSVYIWDTPWPNFKDARILPGDNINPVRGVAFSPNSELLVSATPYSATVWDIATGNVRQTISWTNSTFPRVRATSSLDGTLFAITCGNSTKIINPATRAIREFPENSRVSGIAISPDSKYIAITSTTNDIKIQDIQTGAIHCTIRHDFQARLEQIYYMDIEFSPDGKMLAVVNELSRPPGAVIIFKGVEEDSKVSGCQ